MKIKPKMYQEELYELDNYLNEEEDDRYSTASNSTIWYSWSHMTWKKNYVKYAEFSKLCVFLHP